MNAYHIIRPLIFKMKPEDAHEATIALLRLAGKVPPAQLFLRAVFHASNAPKVQAFGLTFSNPLGLAAGFDKNAEAYRGLATLGFGHIEVGTVTPRPQPGNPRPNLYRLVDDVAVINRNGFRNQGAEKMVKNLQNRRRDGLVLGVNIGKNKTTLEEEAVFDYLYLLRTMAPFADYLAINVSSPNTPGLRNLQSREKLEALLAPLTVERAVQAKALGRNIPLLVKLAPDLSDPELDDALDVIQSAGIDGVVISNTTIQREGLHSPLASEMGGLSGKPLAAISTAMVRKVVQRTQGRLPVVASGGVHSAADAQEKLDAGAVLVQLLTGMIYEGPGLVQEIIRDGLKVNTGEYSAARRTSPAGGRLEFPTTEAVPEY